MKSIFKRLTALILSLVKNDQYAINNYTKNLSQLKGLSSTSFGNKDVFVKQSTNNIAFRGECSEDYLAEVSNTSTNVLSEIRKKTYKIGITGGIACGKSAVKKTLEKLNVPTVDADDIVKGLYEDKDIIKQVVDIFDSTVLKDDNSIDHQKLGQIVFKDRKKLKQLEAILHPPTYKAIKEFMDNNNNDIVAVIIPLLFENNNQEMFDSVWLVTATEEQQIARLKVRNNLSTEDARIRIAAQMPQPLKMALADEIIDNTGSLDNLEKQVISLVNRIRSKI